MRDFSELIQELRELAQQATATADALERLQNLRYETKWTVDVEEAAQLLGIDKNTVYEYCRQKQIPHIKLGKRILIPTLALMKWLEQGVA